MTNSARQLFHSVRKNSRSNPIHSGRPGHGAGSDVRQIARLDAAVDNRLRKAVQLGIRAETDGAPS